MPPDDLNLGVATSVDSVAGRHYRSALRHRLYASTVFLSAFLLFVVQPLTGRLVLPVLGGSAAVWTTTLVFFQLVLLAGYGWAHLGTALARRTQIVAQVVLLVGVAWLLPANIVAVDIPDEPTVGGLLSLLVRLVGLPAFAVAVNASLLQRWFADSDPDRRTDPSFLYAFSNAGSFAGLVMYPFVIEPALTLTSQRVLWGAGCGVLAVLVALCGWPLWRQPQPTADTPREDEPRITARQRAEWFVLGLVPVSLLSGVTAYLSTELLPMPLLWVVPLAVYLLTFVTSFSGRVLRLDHPYVAVVPLVAVPLLVWHLRGGAPLWALVAVHLAIFAIVAALCHGRLRDNRPRPVHLTEFYWWIACGGATGGALNALVAPAMFTTPAEYPLMLIVSALVIAARARSSSGAFRLAFGVLVAATAFWAVAASEPAPAVGMLPLLLVLTAGTMRPAFRAAIAATLAVMVVKLAVTGDTRKVLTARSVFAALRVVDDWHPGVRALVHGSTIHGLQAQDRVRRSEPLSYYARGGPIGELMAALSPRLADRDIGVIGLGVGELAAYAEKGQRWTFYEIDPEVARIAADRALFTYLRDAPAETRTVLGDGRRSIVRDSTQGPFTLLILDAFTSDAVPMHLLTVEAFRAYATKLSADGVIAVHISNRFLDLRPVAAATADGLGFDGLWVSDAGSTNPRRGRYPSEWVVVAARANLPKSLMSGDTWRPLDRIHRRVLWTDEKATLFRALRTR